MSITLATLNASYIHASLGLRYLYANMGELQSSTRLCEFTINDRAEDIVETLLIDQPDIIGFGVYIWNVTETTRLIGLLKVLRPDIRIILGGPEASYANASAPVLQHCDHVITGQADTAFRDLCNQILAGDNVGKQISSLPLQLDTLQSPYPYYNSEDIDNRVIYVEASRGCPFKCEFCLSSLDKTAVGFDIEIFLREMQSLINRGARHFKFVDRTFNLKIETSKQILQFFLAHIDKGLFLHFELIPDRLPDPLKILLGKFPPQSLQFEIGIQSFNPEVQKLISRRQKHDQTCNNLIWLRQNTSAHIHADLIVGLPGENLHSFAEGFDLLYSLGPQEIQIGILKRLAGTPITRHTQDFDMRYMPAPPYRILATRDIDYPGMQSMVRFARYWDLVANSGRFPASLPLLLGNAPFHNFKAISDWIYASCQQTHKISLPRLFGLLHDGMQEALALSKPDVTQALLSDFAHNKIKGRPVFTQQSTKTIRQQTPGQSFRQRRHVAVP